MLMEFSSQLKPGYLQRGTEKRVRFDCTPPIVHHIGNQQQQQQQQGSRADCLAQPPPAPGLPAPVRGGTGNNVDIFRQINALLENTLDLRGVGSNQGAGQNIGGDFSRRQQLGNPPRPEIRENEVPHIDANLLAAARAQIQSSSSTMDTKMSPPPPISTNSSLPPPQGNGGTNGTDFISFLPNVPGSPVSQSTWSSHPVCTNPKDAITLSNIDRYLNGGGAFPVETVGHIASMLECSPAPSDQYPSSLCSVSSPSSDSSVLWDYVFSPINQTMGAGSRDQKCPSPSDSDSSGVSSAGSMNDALAESLSEMMGNLNLTGDPAFRHPNQQMGLNMAMPNISPAMLLQGGLQGYQGGLPGGLNPNMPFPQAAQSMLDPNMYRATPPPPPLDFNDPNVQALTRQLLMDPKLNSLEKLFNALPTDPSNIEKLARLNRQAASICQPTCTWSGQLPPKVYRNPTYSGKVFLGGVPWDITEAGLQASFKPFGLIRVEWPGKDGKHPRYPPKAVHLFTSRFLTPVDRSSDRSPAAGDNTKGRRTKNRRERTIGSSSSQRGGRGGFNITPRGGFGGAPRGGFGGSGRGNFGGSGRGNFGGSRRGNFGGSGRGRFGGSGRGNFGGNRSPGGSLNLEQLFCHICQWQCRDIHVRCVTI
eukprot:XP_011662313.1 PREDICTED: cytoplasmic polyadenylation element-binding protein 1-A [Strongylocentrotus purpuratus]